MGLFFEQPQHNVPQKITFFKKIYDYGNKNIVFSNHSESHNKRWITNEFSMICEAGYFLVDNDRIYSIFIRVENFLAQCNNFKNFE